MVLLHGQAEEAQLREMLANNVPEGHAMRGHLQATLEMVLANASMPFAAKHKFMVQIICDTCDTKLPHLGQERASRALSES